MYIFTNIANKIIRALYNLLHKTKIWKDWQDCFWKSGDNQLSRIPIRQYAFNADNYESATESFKALLKNGIENIKTLMLMDLSAVIVIFGVYDYDELLNGNNLL